MPADTKKHALKTKACSNNYVYYPKKMILSALHITPSSFLCQLLFNTK